LRLFAGRLACPTDGLCFLPGLALRRFFIRFAALHLAKDALALHLLLENPESLIHVVVANKYLQTFSDRVVAASCGVGSAVALMNLRALPTIVYLVYIAFLFRRQSRLRSRASAFDSGWYERSPCYLQELYCVSHAIMTDKPHRSGAERLQAGFAARKGERLEINISMPHMEAATFTRSRQAACADPVKRYLACLPTFSDSPDHAGVSSPTVRHGIRGRRALRTCAVSHNIKIVFI
jgi:hypothetical protein